MYQATVALPATSVNSEDFRVEDLYDLQRRQGKLKPPVISYEQRNSLKKKLGRQDSLDCSLVRAMCHAFQDFGSLSSWFLWNPLEPFNSGFAWVRYALFGSSSVDNIVSGRNRMARLRPSYTKDPRDMLQLERQYDPYQQRRH